MHKIYLLKLLITPTIHMLISYLDIGNINSLLLQPFLSHQPLHYLTHGDLNEILYK